MANSILQSYVANAAGRAVGALGTAGLATGFLYQQKYGRSFLPFMGTSRVSQAAAQAGGVAPELGYQPAPDERDEGPSEADLSLRSSGDRILDNDNDGIPDHINLISGSGDTYRTLTINPGTMSQLAERYDAQEEMKKEEALEKEFSVDGVTSKLKNLVAKEAGRAVGIPKTRYEMVTGRDVISGGIKTGVPLIDFLQPVGQAMYDKFVLPDLEEAAAKAAMGEEGYGVFTLGGGQAVAITPDGIVSGGIDTFLQTTGRTITQLETELKDKTAAGLGGGYLGSLYQSYVGSPITPTTSFEEIKGRSIYEQTILNSTLSTDMKSKMLGGADLRPTVTGSDGTTYTGFAGTVRFDASTGEVIKDNTPTGTYYEEDYTIPDPTPQPDPEPSQPSQPSYQDTSGWSGGGDDDDGGSSSGSSWSSSPSSGDDWSSWIAQGGEVTPKRDMEKDNSPIQRTGFVSGSPDNYTERETVADTEFRRVRDGSFVLNAPTVEQLQQAGMLPSGVDKPKKDAKIKASEGGLISVALSKGEVVLEPEEAEYIGYDVLEALNNQGKSEVDRRQANMGGRVGLSGGGNVGAVSPGRIGFLGTILPPLDITGPQVQYQSPTEVPSESFKDVEAQPTTQSYKKFTDFEALSADLLTRLEGNTPVAYVPNVGNQASDISGVTVGLGFDIGQHSISDLEKMGLNQNLISKLVPYVNKRGDSARQVLSSEPLELNSQELEEVNTIVLKSKLDKFNQDFPEYADLRDIDRAIMFSNAYSGSLNRYKTFRSVYEEGRNMRDAITRGLINRISRGDPERNRAEKALKWYAGEQTKRMSGPKPRPNLSATR